ncbi:hypothetical protein ACTFIT_003323 [Dictyostelium discoideum]
MADDHSTELQLNHTDNNTTNTNNTSTTSTTKNKSVKIDTPKKQTPTNQLSLNKGLDNQLDIIAPPSITRPLSFLEKNNNTINIKCYFNQPLIREELTSKDDTRIQQIHKNIHKLFEDILSPSAFKIIGATAFVNCNVDKLTSIINLQNQLALNIDKLNYRFDISSNDYAIIKTFIKTYSPKHANDAITNNLTKFTSCTSIESFTVTYSYAVAFKSYIITYHLIDHTHNIVDQKIEQPSGITRYIKAATRSVTKHKIQHAKNADMATTIKNAITNPNMNKNNQPPKNNINTPPINEIANSNRNKNSLQNSGSKAILNESLDINNQSQNNNEISHKRFTENPNNQHNSYQKAVDTLQLLISKLPPRPTISILTELNSSPLQLKHDFPDHIISVTKRGNGVIIINHNPNTLKLKHISTIDGRAILADVIFPNQLPIGILGIYAPASNNTIKKNSYATSLPPTLKEIYSTILNNHQCKSKDYIGKKYSDLLLTQHQQSIQLLWKYTYNQLFVKIQKLKDPKGRDTMQRFHARCLPINHLHNKVCPICNNEMNNDPYGHLFFNCQHTINFINHDKLKYFIYKNCNGNKNWSLTKNQTTKLYTLIYKPQTNNKAFKPDPTININFHFAENAQYKKYRFNWNYINTNLDLVRTHAYWNIISLVIHQIWIWLCKSLFDINITQSIDNWNNQINNTTLDYDILKSKWHKLIRLEYSRTLSNFNQYSIKNNLTKTQKETQWSETIKKFKKEWSINTNEPIPTITPPINY